MQRTKQLHRCFDVNFLYICTLHYLYLYIQYMVFIFTACHEKICLINAILCQCSSVWYISHAAQGWTFPPSPTTDTSWTLRSLGCMRMGMAGWCLQKEKSKILIYTGVQLLLEQNKTNTGKSFTFFCPRRCLSSIFYSLFLTPFHTVVFSSLETTTHETLSYKYNIFSYVSAVLVIMCV